LKEERIPTHGTDADRIPAATLELEAIRDSVKWVYGEIDATKVEAQIKVLIVRDGPYL
jgi:hypothetical protein